MNNLKLNNIKAALYLVADPKPGLETVLPKIIQAIEGGCDIIQIWNNWSENQNKSEFIEAVCKAANKKIPVLINEEWEYLKSTSLDGVHFDQIPPDIDKIRSVVNKDFITGITCGNDLSRLQWAETNKVDYVSFCSMFPSASVGDCEIVKIETIKKARNFTELPVFLSGGINLNNLNELLSCGANGIALISGILNADDPKLAAEKFKKKLLTAD